MTLPSWQPPSRAAKHYPQQKRSDDAIQLTGSFDKFIFPYSPLYFALVSENLGLRQQQEHQQQMTLPNDVSTGNMRRQLLSGGRYIHYSNR
jgi:hypothetical protein